MDTASPESLRYLHQLVVTEIANILKRDDWANVDTRSSSSSSILPNRLDSILLKLKLSAIEISEENDRVFENARFDNGTAVDATRRRGYLLDIRRVLRCIDEALPMKFVLPQYFFLSCGSNQCIFFFTVLNSVEQLGLLFDQLETAVDNLQAHTERLRSLATDMSTETNHHLQTTMSIEYQDATHPAKVEPMPDVKYYAEQLPNTNQFFTSMPDRASEWSHVYEASSADTGRINHQPGGENPSSLTGTSATGPRSKKRKRNKPTLSCKECVDKKIKVSRQGTFPGGRNGKSKGLFPRYFKCWTVPTIRSLDRNRYSPFWKSIFWLATWIKHWVLD